MPTPHSSREHSRVLATYDGYSSHPAEPVGESPFAEAMRELIENVNERRSANLGAQLGPQRPLLRLVRSPRV